MSTEISFEDLPLGTTVSNQYLPLGVEFTLPPILVGDSIAPNQGHVLEATDRSGSNEFPDWTIRARFTSPTHSHVGLSANQSGTITIFDAAGNTIGSSYLLRINPGYIYGEVFATNGNIASFEYTSQSSVPLKIDSLIFDNLVAPREPDFRLIYTGGIVYIKPGEIVFVTVSVIRLLESEGTINFSVSSLPSSIIASATPQVFNGPSGATVSIGIQGRSWSNSNPIVTNQPIIVSGLPSPEAGSTTREVNIPVTVLEPYDAQIIGMEVTQAIQPFQLPAKDRPTDVTPVQYTGVQLVKGKMTRVRVFCSWRQHPRRGEPIFELEISGHAEGSAFTLPESPLKPELGVPFFEGDIVTPAIRAQRAADFILPPSWTKGDLLLRAKLIPALSFEPDTYETDLDNNNFALMHIVFTEVVDLHIVPFQLRIRDHYLDFPQRVFEETRNLLPLGDDQFYLSNYSKVVDITEVALNTDGDSDDRGIAVRNLLSHAVHGWNFRATSRNFLVGVFSADFASQIHSRTMSDGFWNDAWNWIAGKERVAIVHDGGRRLANTAHEIGHLCGRLHAGEGQPPVEAWPPDERGLLDGVGVDARNGRVIYPGVPDEIFDFMSYAGTFSDDDLNRWVSIRGWNGALNWIKPNFFDLLFGLTNHQLMAVQSLTSSMPANELTLESMSVEKLQRIIAEASILRASRHIVTVYADLSETRSARITHVAMSENGYPLSGPESQYKIAIKDESGTILASAPPLQENASEIPDNFSFLKATLSVQNHDNIKSVEVHLKGKVIASRHRPKNPPEITGVSIHEISASATTAPGREVRWRSSCEDGTTPLAQVDVSLSNQQESLDDSDKWQNIYTGPSNSSGINTTYLLPETYFPANPCTRIRLRVSDGFNESSYISEEFHCVGFDPRVWIVYPKCDAKFTFGSHVYLHGEAIDDREKRVTKGDGCQEEGVRWTVNGNLVSEDAIASWFPAKEDMVGCGEVMVRFEAVDYRGRMKSDEIKLLVTG